MNIENYIPIDILCTHYRITTTFFEGLNDYGLIEIITVETSPSIHQKHIKRLEAIIRMHDELQLNYEGIDTALNLLERIEALQSELNSVKRRLRLYEDGFSISRN